MVKYISAFLNKLRIFLGLGCQHGPNMDPCWHPKSMKTRKKRVPEGVQKALHFGARFHVILVPSWPPKVGALDGPRQGPRALKRRPRRPPRRSRSRLERTFFDFGQFFGNRSPRTPQNDPRNRPKSLENCWQNRSRWPWFNPMSGTFFQRSVCSKPSGDSCTT